MYVRVTTGITAGKNRGEGDLAAGVADLQAAQEVFVLHGVRVKRIGSIACAVPEVDGITGQGRAEVVRVHQRDLEGERHAWRGIGRNPEARTNVTAYDA